MYIFLTLEFSLLNKIYMCDISAFLNDSATIMNSETSDVERISELGKPY